LLADVGGRLGDHLDSSQCFHELEVMGHEALRDPLSERHAVVTKLDRGRREVAMAREAGQPVCSRPARDQHAKAGPTEPVHAVGKPAGFARKRTRQTGCPVHGLAVSHGDQRR
jgi:hypothetical protein